MPCSGHCKPLHLLGAVRLHGGVRGGVQGGDRFWRISRRDHDHRPQEEDKLPPSPDVSTFRWAELLSLYNTITVQSYHAGRGGGRRSQSK